MAGKPKDDPKRPKQGAHLLELRKAAGLTQAQLAEFLEVPQGTIALWERSAKPPRSEVLPQMAKALGVAVDDLLLQKPSKKQLPLTRNAGPVSHLQRVFEEVRVLPRRQQQRIIDVVEAMLEKHSKKAS